MEVDLAEMLPDAGEKVCAGAGGEQGELAGPGPGVRPRVGLAEPGPLLRPGALTLANLE